MYNVPLMRIHERHFALTGILAILYIGCTIKALTKNLKRVIERLKAVCNADIILHLYDTSVIKLDDLCTCGADKMIVMRTVNSLFVLCMSLAETVARNKSAFMQEVQRFVDRRS